MNEKQAAMIGELMKKPKFAMLQGLCSELGQAQENALNNKHKALHMQMITFTQTALHKLGSAHKKSHGLGDSSPPSAPSTGGSSNHGVGSAPPAPSNNGVGDAPPSPDNGGGDFNPANWDVAKYGVDHYIKTLYYLYDKLRTTESGNPNALLYFLEGLSKLSQYGGSSLLDQFTKGLCNQTGALNHIFASGNATHGMNPQSFATLIAFALVTLAVYQTAQKGGSTQDVLAQIEQYESSALGGSNPFLAQIRSALNGLTSEKGLPISLYPNSHAYYYNVYTLINMMHNHSGGQVANGVPAISKIFLQQILESLFGGAQGSNDPDSINNSQAAVRQAFSQGILNELNQMEKNGATIAELIDFVMMQYNLSADDAGAYVGNINDLSGLEGDTSTLLGLFSPGKYAFSGDESSYIADFMSHLGAYYRLTEMWPNSPNVVGGGEGSLADILTGQLMDNLNSLSLNQNVLNCLGSPKPQVVNGIAHWRGISFPANASFGQLMKQFKGLFQGAPGSANATNAAWVLITLIGYKNHEPETTASSDHIVKRDGELDSIVSSLQAVESQVSSANETAKSEYQQANQTSANMLSTGGDMMKDLMKMFSTATQNQKAGA